MVDHNLKVEEKRLNVLMVGCDLTSRGGIASVVKTYHHANMCRKAPIKLELLKTSYYKDANLLLEFYILLKSFLLYCFKLLTCDFDIVHIQSSSGISFYRKTIFFLVGRLFRKKIIIHLHSSNFYEFFLSNNAIKHFICQTVFSRSNLILVLCHDWQVKLLQSYKNITVRTLANPINIKDYDYGSDVMPKSESDLNVLFLGFLINSKGIHDILKLGIKLKENRIPKIKILIAGKGELETTIMNDIQSNALADIIKFIGWVEGEKKKELLKRADVYFLPSYKEGMPISILEAMCNGLPILSTKIAGIPELVKEDVNGYLFEPGDVDGYYRTLMALAENHDKTRSLGQGSLRLVKQFDADIIFDKLIGIYDGLL